MPVDEARLAVSRAFTAVVRGGAYAPQAAKREFSALDIQQRRFALKLLNETLDQIYYLDYCLANFANYETTADGLVDILRLGACQICFLDSVPDHAALDSTVELAKARGFERQAGFVNGVLRNFLRRRAKIVLPDKGKDPEGYLSARYSWPKWMTHMFVQQLGVEAAEGFMSYRPDHHMTIRANPLKGAATQKVLERLEKAGVPCRLGELVPEAIQILSADNLAATPLFQKGYIAIQGEGSQLISRLCAETAGKGATILDACAAPGGKTAAVAAYLDGACTLTAWDIHEHRVELIRQTLNRLGVEAQIELHDAGLPDDRRFDMVLVDAPCSGLGIAYNSPDIKIQRKQREMDELIAIQRRILTNAAEMVKEGGHLLYSTCTVSRRENENNVSWLLEHDKTLEAVPLREVLPDLPAEEGSHMLQLLPHVHHAEGFFMALMRKRP
ncbi:MAG: 16S rRNA (cytosine(967)-C(5))-methyltransferase RsmB [Eubacteriales bacterium]|nr:16S rRNA (cytosine(967)-C(5))-methyltransferase RsmB [Eubacteriales bacterium]